MFEALAMADIFLPYKCYSLELPAGRMLATDGGASSDTKWDFAYQCESDKWLNHKRHPLSKNNQLGCSDELRERKVILDIEFIFLYSLINSELRQFSIYSIWF